MKFQKYLPALLLVTGCLQAQNMHTYSESVYEKWPSPTPHIKDRFTDFLDYMPQNAVAVEVGVQGGAYAEHMLRRTHPKTLYLIDCWEHQDPFIYDDPEANVSNEEQQKLYLETKARFAKNPEVIILRQYSENACHQFLDESLDWVYIDANHSYEAAREDIARWWPKVKKGGILSGHDYIVRESFGVVQAVNEFLIYNGLNLDFLTTENNYDSWAVKKPVL